MTRRAVIRIDVAALTAAELREVARVLRVNAYTYPAGTAEHAVLAGLHDQAAALAETAKTTRRRP